MSAVAPLLRRVYSKAFSLMLVSLSGFSMNRVDPLVDLHRVVYDLAYAPFG